jgi:hypothetical protein
MLAYEAARSQRVLDSQRGRAAILRARLRCANSDFVLALGAEQPVPFLTSASEGGERDVTASLHLGLLCALIDHEALNLVEWLLTLIGLRDIGGSLAVLARTGRVDFLEAANAAGISFDSCALDTAILHGHHAAALWLYQQLNNLGHHTGQDLLALQGVLLAAPKMFANGNVQSKKSAHWLMVAAVASGQPYMAQRALKAVRSSFGEISAGGKCRFLCRHSAIVRRDKAMLAWLETHLPFTFYRDDGALETACIAWPAEHVIGAFSGSLPSIRTAAIVYAARNGLWGLVEQLWRAGVNITPVVMRLAIAHGDRDAMWRVLCMQGTEPAKWSARRCPRGSLREWPVTDAWRAACQCTQLFGLLIARGRIDLLDALHAWVCDAVRYYPSGAIDMAAAQGDAGLGMLRWLSAQLPKTKGRDPCAAAARVGSLYAVRWLREVAQWPWQESGLAACAEFCRLDPDRGADLMAYAIRDRCSVPENWPRLGSIANNYRSAILPLLKNHAVACRCVKDKRFAAQGPAWPSAAPKVPTQRTCARDGDESPRHKRGARKADACDYPCRVRCIVKPQAESRSRCSSRRSNTSCRSSCSSDSDSDCDSSSSDSDAC